jgi:hypothetical protein
MVFYTFLFLGVADFVGDVNTFLRCRTHNEMHRGSVVIQRHAPIITHCRSTPALPCLVARTQR